MIIVNLYSEEKPIGYSMFISLKKVFRIDIKNHLKNLSLVYT